MANKYYEDGHIIKLNQDIFYFIQKLYQYCNTSTFQTSIAKFVFVFEFYMSIVFNTSYSFKLNESIKKCMSINKLQRARVMSNSIEQE